MRPSLRILALVVALSSLALSCRREEPKPEPTKPWRADEGVVATSPDRQPARTRYRLLPGQRLQFSLGGKDARPEGEVPLRDGFLELDPLALEHVRGELHLDLGELSVGASSVPDAAWTAEARRWLGLGRLVDDGERRKNARGTFRIELAKALTQRAAFRGELLRGDDGQPTGKRRVLATALGRLSLRELEVEHAVRVEVVFSFDESPSAQSLPRRVQVTLLQPGRVPLAEHEIAPRDESGTAIAGLAQAAAKQVGKVAEVRGSITFER